MKGRYDNLHGDEPEIDALARNAEAGRDVDAEIDRKLERMEEWDKKRDERLRNLLQYQAMITFMIDELSNLLRVSLTVVNLPSHSADNVAKQAERLQALCREMAK